MLFLCKSLLIAANCIRMYEDIKFLPLCHACSYGQPACMGILDTTNPNKPCKCSVHTFKQLHEKSQLEKQIFGPSLPPPKFINLGKSHPTFLYRPFKRKLTNLKHENQTSVQQNILLSHFLADWPSYIISLYIKKNKDFHFLLHPAQLKTPGFKINKSKHAHLCLTLTVCCEYT